jgi:hypothetical protein
LRQHGAAQVSGNYLTAGSVFVGFDFAFQAEK